jgi:threonine aldolase
MLRAMVAAELGDDVYGEDPTVRELEALAARLLGKEAGCLLPSGTMANLASILTHCPRGSKAIVGDESDIYVYEGGGASVCGGVVYHPVRNQPDGTLDLAEVAAAFPPDPEDPQYPTPALLCLENPQNHSGGHVLPMSYLEETAALTLERGIALHMDGARLFNAALVLGIDAAGIARYADSVQFCLSKGLGAPVGSMVVGRREFVTRVRWVRKMLGGGMRQAGVLAAAGIVALKSRSRLRDDHATARRLADGLAGIPGIEVEPAEPRINIVYFRVPGQPVGNFLAAAAARGVSLAELGPGRIRAVTHVGVTAADIEHTLDVARSITAAPTETRRSHDSHIPVLAR